MPLIAVHNFMKTFTQFNYNVKIQTAFSYKITADLEKSNVLLDL